MKILHLDIVIEENFITCLYFWDNPNQINSYQISAILPNIDLENPIKTGQLLYKWLNGNEHILNSLIGQVKENNAMLALYGLPRLPWQLLHNGEDFLFNLNPAIVPVCCYKISIARENLIPVVNGNLNVLLLVSSDQKQSYRKIQSGFLEANKENLIAWQLVNSGTLAELSHWLTLREKNHYDIVHLVGKSVFNNDQISFVNQNLASETIYSYPVKIAEAFQYNFPKLLFISGLQSELLVEELLELGAQNILICSNQDEAISELAIFYQQLSQGNNLINSLVFTYQFLQKIENGLWQSLCLHVKGILPDKLIDKSTSKIFSKSSVNISIPRDDLQKILQVLIISANQERGIIISSKNNHSVINQLKTILIDYQGISWQRKINPVAILEKLLKINPVELEEQLDFKLKLREIFKQLNNIKLLFIFNQFEWNLNCKNNQYTLKPEIEEILKSLLWAIREGNFRHRIIISSLYEFAADISHSFYIASNIKVDSLEHEEVLELDLELQTILRNCLVYEEPVPIEAFQALCQSLNNYQKNLLKAINLEIIELIYPKENLYLVSSIVPQILPNLKLDKQIDSYFILARKAKEILIEKWAKRENDDECKWREIFRLILVDTANTARFKEGFLLMISMQYNSSCDSAFEKELRAARNSLGTETTLEYLENYLKTKNWREADLETAWIFYQILILGKSRGFKELYENISFEFLHNIDNLWTSYSGGIFGFKRQFKIWRELESLKKDNQDDLWNQFGTLLGWKEGEQWLEYEGLSFALESKPGNLPALCIMGTYSGGWGSIGSRLGWNQPWILGRRISALMSRFSAK